MTKDLHSDVCPQIIEVFVWEGGRAGYMLVRSTPSTCFVIMGETYPLHEIIAGSLSYGIHSLEIIILFKIEMQLSVRAQNRNHAK